MHGTFFALILVGVALTYIFNEEFRNNPYGLGPPKDNIIYRNFGYNNMCLYFDYRPVGYISPALYNIVVGFTTVYCYCSGIRVWLGMVSNNVKSVIEDCLLFNFWTFGAV